MMPQNDRAGNEKLRVQPGFVSVSPTTKEKGITTRQFWIPLWPFLCRMVNGSSWNHGLPWTGAPASGTAC